jgi:hypothetical protein
MTGMALAKLVITVAPQKLICLSLNYTYILVQLKNCFVLYAANTGKTLHIITVPLIPLNI